jgi:hypothetical protein
MQAYMNNSVSVMHIKWEPPPTCTLKFKVDRSESKRNGFSTCGGLLRDAKAGLIQGFYCNLDRNNYQGAKMWSLLHVMCIARNLDLENVIF